MVRQLYGLALRGIFFLLAVLPSFTARQGNIPTYLPFAQRGGYDLPVGNLLLYNDNAAQGNLFLSPVPPNGTHFQLTDSDYVSFPTFSPDGNWIAYYDRSPFGSPTFGVMGTGGAPRIPLPGVTLSFAWSSDNRTLAYFRNYTGYGNDIISSIGIDSRTPITLATNATFRHAWDLDGVGLFYPAVNANGETDDLRYVRADGTGNRLVAEIPGKTFLWGVVGDGRILFRIYDIEIDSDEIYLIRPDGSDLTRLTYLHGYEWRITLAPNKDKIAFAIGSMIYVIDLAGTVLWSFDCGEECGVSTFPFSWSPDGNTLAVTIEREVGSFYEYDLYITDVISGATPTLILTDGAGRHGFSPDGRYFAYDVDPPTGRDFIQVIDRFTLSESPIVSKEQSFYFEAWRPMP